MQTDAVPGDPAGGLTHSIPLQAEWDSSLSWWLRGLIDDPSSALPSLARVIETVRGELQKRPAVGALFVRIERWGRAADLFRWQELDEVYENLSHLTLDIVGRNLRALDLPTDLGVHGEGFAVILAVPRESDELTLEKVEGVAERYVEALRENFARSLPVDLASRVSVQVGAGIIRRPEGEATLEQALVSGLVEAENAAREIRDIKLRELRRAIARQLAEGDVGVLFQPVVDLRGGRVVGMDSMPQGPASLDLGPEDVFLDAVRRTGLAYRAMDCYQTTALSRATDSMSGDDFLLMRTEPSGLLESAIRVTSLLHGRPEGALTRFNIVFMVDGAQTAEFFPSTVSAFRSVAEMGFRLGIDLHAGALPALARIRELGPDLIRVGGTSVKGVHRDPDEFDTVLMIARFAARHGAQVLAADCGEQKEVTALRKAGVQLAQGGYFSPYLTCPVWPEVRLP